MNTLTRKRVRTAETASHVTVAAARKRATAEGGKGAWPLFEKSSLGVVLRSEERSPVPQARAASARTAIEANNFRFFMLFSLYKSTVL